MLSCCGCRAATPATSSPPIVSSQSPSKSLRPFRRRFSSTSPATARPQSASLPADDAPSSYTRNIADDLLDGTPRRNEAHDYAALVGARYRARRWVDVLSVLPSMAADGAVPDRFLLPKFLKACSQMRDRRIGAAIHGCIIAAPLEVDVFVWNSLIDMYCKCGDLASAHNVFDRMSERDVVSWTALVNAYADAGFLDEAEVIFKSMRANGIRPDLISWNALISGFARNGETDTALCLLDDMRGNGMRPGANSWNGIISGLVQSGCFEDALEIFREMCSHEKPNAITIASVLPACWGISALNLGQELHSYALKNAIRMNVFMCGSLINMYVKCGKIASAERVFAELENRNEIVWNTMIAAYIDEDKMSEALRFLDLMQKDGFLPDIITYNTFIAAYARKGKRDEALKFMSEAFRNGLKPNVVSMSALISGFHHSGLNKEALDLFRSTQWPNLAGAKCFHLPVSMKNVAVRPNDATITSILSACADLKLHYLGKEVHGFLLRNNFEGNVFIASALVDVYAKCGDMFSAAKVFHGIKDKNVVSWNILMAGHNNNEQPESAFKLFLEMLEQNFHPSSITMMILLLACTKAVALTVGRQLHCRIEKNRPDGYPVTVVSALINMYARCGSIRDAKSVFDHAVEKDLAVWNAMLAGYSLHRMTKDVLDLFKQMEQSGIRPDHITFTAILSACNREGFIEEGWKHFSSMVDVYGVSPTLEHFTCVVDMLGTAGLLEESVGLIRSMPFEPDACIWTTLLKASRLHSNFEIGERAARALFELEPQNAF